MKKLLSLTCILLVGCGQAGPAARTAQERGVTPSLAALGHNLDAEDRQRFQQADANGDGRLSADEVGESLALLDEDRDGFLTFAEALSQTPSAGDRARVAKPFIDGLTPSQVAELGVTAPRIALGDPFTIAPQLSATSNLNPVVLIPGYMDSLYLFYFIRKKLEGQGRSVAYMVLFPNVGDITVASAKLQATVAELKTRTGAPKVDLVAHSMGGLISRHYLQERRGLGEIERLVTIATPHHGTIMSKMSPTKGAQQMNPGSPFLKALNANDETPGDVKYTSIRGSMDEVVVPHTSPILDGAKNLEVKFAMHGTILAAPSTWNHVKEALSH